ncbi:MAG: hypothetical protein AAGJ81_13140 [Verrucomicrobiota bacterium]
MIFLRRFYRWRYFRRQRGKRYRPFGGASGYRRISFGKHLARSTREGKEFPGFRDRVQRRRRRVIRIVLSAIALLFLGWIVYESIYGLSLF